MDNDHSSRTTITRSLKRPTRELGRATLNALLFGLAPSGVCRASDVTTGAGELLPHRFTLTSGNKSSPRRSTFCGTFLPVTGTGRYPAPCPMELGLSSPPAAEKRQARGSDHLTYSILTASSDMSLYLPLQATIYGLIRQPISLLIQFTAYMKNSIIVKLLQS